MADLPRIQLNDGTSMPLIGFGVFQVPADETARIVGEALALGYRSIDTAWGYFNEEGVGRAIAESGIPRDELHITTKVWRQGREDTIESFESSLEKLGLERLDLLLIHWPAPANDRYVETWETFLELQQSGRLTSVGVSNFQPEHLGRIIEATGVVPVINQVELHPYLQQRQVRDFDALHGIRRPRCRRSPRPERGRPSCTPPPPCRSSLPGGRRAHGPRRSPRREQPDRDLRSSLAAVGAALRWSLSPRQERYRTSVR